MIVRNSNLGVKSFPLCRLQQDYTWEWGCIIHGDFWRSQRQIDPHPAWLWARELQISFCLSVCFLSFLSPHSICFFPSLFLAIFVVLYIFHALSSASVLLRFPISCLPLCLESFFFVCPHLAFSLPFAVVSNILRDSGPAVSEMIVFAGGALGVYLQWKVRHMLGLRGTCISKEPLSFELVTDKSSVFKSWGCSQVKRTFVWPLILVPFKMVFFSQSFV